MVNIMINNKRQVNFQLLKSGLKLISSFLKNMSTISIKCHNIQTKNKSRYGFHLKIFLQIYNPGTAKKAMQTTIYSSTQYLRNVQLTFFLCVNCFAPMHHSLSLFRKWRNRSSSQTQCCLPRPAGAQRSSRVGRQIQTGSHFGSLCAR